MTALVDRISVAGRVVMITGAGRGIGRVYAREFALAGARVGIAEIDEASAQAVALEIRQAGGTAFAVQTDVGSPDSVRNAVEAISRELGPIEILINNAALFASVRRYAFDEIPFAEWEQVMRVNVTGSWLCASAVAPAMRKAGWGRIINVSSSTVPLGVPARFMHYITSKAAIIGLTRTMATELGPQGVTVNCILPGVTETEIEVPGRTDAIRQKILDTQRVKRPGVPEDLAGMVLFLASPAADFITGQSLVVDGGAALL
jgi:3-oxoacyl-[acyl-carrier protein] reductase